MIESTAPETIAAALRGMAARPDVTALLPEIDVPALVVCGQFDEISTPEEMRGIAAVLPQGSFVEIPEAGHMGPVTMPDRVAESILVELSRHAST